MKFGDLTYEGIERCAVGGVDDPNADSAAYSPNGVVGTPIYASVELGEKLWKEAVESIADTFKAAIDVEI